MTAPLDENSGAIEGRYNASMIEITHLRRFLCTCTTLVFIALAGCDRAAPPPSTTGPAPDSATKPAPEPLSSPAAEPRPIPTTIATPPPTKPAPGPEPVKSSEPVTTGEPDIKDLPDRTQRLIRDTRKALADAPGSGDLPTKLGMIYLTNNLQRESIPLFRLAIERVPRQAANWYYLGIALSETKDSEGAVAAFQKAVSIDKSLLYAHLRLANLLLESDKDAALAEFREVDRLAPKEAETLIQLARGYQKLDRIDDAIATCRKAVEIEPRCPLAHAALADLLTKKGDEANARRHQRLALADGDCNMAADLPLLMARAAGHPTLAGIMRARALANAGKFDIAINGLRRLSIEDPMSMDVLVTLGQVLQMQGSTEEAIKEYDLILLSDPGHLDAAIYLAGAQIAVGRFPAAEKTLTTALARHPDQPDLLQLLARVQAKTNRVDEAKNTFRKAIELTKDGSKARLEFARTLVAAKELDDALKELEPLIGDPVLMPRALPVRASIRDMKRDFKGADEDMRAAIEAEPGLPDHYVTLAIMLTGRREYDRAIQLVHEGIAVHPQDLALQNALAWLLATAPQAHLRDGRKARELAMIVCEKTNYSRHGFLDTLAAACAEVGDFETAQKACRQAIELARRGGDQPMIAEYTDRLSDYTGRRPYRLPE